MESLAEVEPITEFFDAIKNAETKKKYTARLTLFFNHLKFSEAGISSRV